MNHECSGHAHEKCNWEVMDVLTSLTVEITSQSTVGSHSVVSDSLQPRGLQHTRLPCPSQSAGVCSNSCPLSGWCHPTISSSITPFSSCLQSFLASGPFTMLKLYQITACVYQSIRWYALNIFNFYLSVIPQQAESAHKAGPHINVTSDINVYLLCVHTRTSTKRILATRTH